MLLSVYAQRWLRKDIYNARLNFNAEVELNYAAARVQLKATASTKVWCCGCVLRAGVPCSSLTLLASSLQK
jgi:hypothetical protein